MKNKKILYLLTIILTLFSFNLNAKAAAKEMTCVYEIGTQAPKVKIVLTQNSEGLRKIYVNKSDVTLKESGWQSANHEIDISSAEKDATGNLNSCPGSVSIVLIPTDAIGGTKSQMNFYKDDSGKQKKDVTTSTEGQILDITTGSPSSGGDDSSVNEDGSTPTNTSGKTCEEINIEDYITFNEDDSIASCVYAGTLREKKEVIGCHIIQVNFNDNDVIIRTIDPKYSDNININFTSINSYATLTADDIIKQVKEEYDGWCPNRISVKRLGFEDDVTSGANMYLSYNGFKNYSIYKSVKSYGKNLVNPEKKQAESNLGEKDKYINSDDKIYSTCEEMFGDDKSSKILELLKTLVNIVKIMIPILLIGLGIFDFAKAIFAGSDDKMKKAQSKFIKRVIVGICIFLIPSVLELLLTIANSIWGNISTDFCGIL